MPMSLCSLLLCSRTYSARYHPHQPVTPLWIPEIIELDNQQIIHCCNSNQHYKSSIWEYWDWYILVSTISGPW